MLVATRDRNFLRCLVGSGLVTMALASAAGSLGADEATGRLLVLLASARGRDVRMEFALALARLVGEEHRFTQLHRRVDADPSTALSQEVSRLKTRLSRAHQTNSSIEEALGNAADLLAREAVEEGLALLCGALELLSRPADQVCGPIMEDCVAQIRRHGAERLEYAVLALHGSSCGISPAAPQPELDG